MLSPDNYIQDGGYYQNYNRYSYALNNPLKYTDPSGEVILPLLVSIGVGLLTNGISNTMDGKPFFQCATRSIAFSILTYGISSGIGDAAKAAVEKGLLKASEVFVFQAMAHAFAGGLISAMQGGKFMHGFASGALSSLASSASIALQALKAGPVPTVLIGGIAGGLGSVISGGDFFNGFRYGAISSAFNHVTHALMEGGDNSQSAESESSSEPPKKGDICFDECGQAQVFDGNSWVPWRFVVTGTGQITPTDSPIDWVLGAWKTPFQAADDIAVLGFAKFAGRGGKVSGWV